MPPIVFRQRTDGAEPTARFAIDSGTSARTYVSYDENESWPAVALDREGIARQVDFILGTTNPGPSPRPFGSPGGRGSLDRVMPWSDPVYLSCFADVVSLRVDRGEGYAEAITDLPELAVPPAQPGYAGYQGLLYDVAFASRPYAVVPNQQMDFRHDDFFGQDGKPKRVYFYPEWLRFTQRFTKVLDFRISASVANALQFYAPGLAEVHKRTPNSVPDMMVPDVEWRWRWYGVPGRYVDSDDSWLVKLRGYVNQKPFAGVRRGCLLYMGVDTLRTYVPTQFEPSTFAGDEDDVEDLAALEGTFASERLVDLELIFIRTSRGDLEVPRVPGVPFDKNNPLAVPDAILPNKNWIPAGHNLMPHFGTKQFYYAHKKTADPGDGADPSGWQPPYPSWHFACLFADPDVPEQVIDL